MACILRGQLTLSGDGGIVEQNFSGVSCLKAISTNGNTALRGCVDPHPNSNLNTSALHHCRHGLHSSCNNTTVRTVMNGYVDLSKQTLGFKVNRRNLNFRWSIIKMHVCTCMVEHLTCSVYPCSQLKATTSLTIYLSPVLMPLAGIIGSGHVVRPTATERHRYKCSGLYFDESTADQRSLKLCKATQLLHWTFQ